MMPSLFIVIYRGDTKIQLGKPFKMFAVVYTPQIDMFWPVCRIYGLALDIFKSLQGTHTHNRPSFVRSFVRSFIHSFIYLFITFGGNQANLNSTNAFNSRDTSMKCLETDLFTKSSFRCTRENWRTRRKPAEASMDWKPNAHMAPGLGIKLYRLNATECCFATDRK